MLAREAVSAVQSSHQSTNDYVPVHRLSVTSRMRLPEAASSVDLSVAVPPSLKSYDGSPAVESHRPSGYPYWTQLYPSCAGDDHLSCLSLGCAAEHPCLDECVEVG